MPFLLSASLNAKFVILFSDDMLWLSEGSQRHDIVHGKGKVMILDIQYSVRILIKNRSTGMLMTGLAMREVEAIFKREGYEHNEFLSNDINASLCDIAKCLKEHDANPEYDPTRDILFFAAMGE